MAIPSQASVPAQVPARVSVLMPAFEQASFIGRAIEAVLEQTLPSWELVIIDDGSRDRTAEVSAAYLDDARVRYLRLERNLGLGAALNHGLERVSAPLVAYLPCDDVYYRDHLASLVEALDEDLALVAAYTGVRYHLRRWTAGLIEGLPLQLVQVMHRVTQDRWMERRECVTDDLDRMFWGKLRRRGAFGATASVSCEWVDHPGQRHKVVREPYGGINPYRSRYGVAEPLRFHSSVGHPIDEVKRYRRFRDRPDTPPSEDGLKILLVGELAYNPERVLALEERGHKLYGLWSRSIHWYNTVGPVPFGHVDDLEQDAWLDAVRRIKPDIVYALLNWQAVPLAHEVLASDTGIPFVWHFKESPFICLEKGTWPQLVDLYGGCDGRIYSSPELRDWFDTVLPRAASGGEALVLDGDLPKLEWFDAEPSPRLSETEGGIHTVVAGRAMGLRSQDIGDLARQDIHLHLYGYFNRPEWREWLSRSREVAPEHLHLHEPVGQELWVGEFSKYDAGWLHMFRSHNGGEIRRADWNDLNYPARLPTLLSAGLPLLQPDNRGAVVATQALVRELDLGVFIDDMGNVRDQLGDTERMNRLRENAWRHRNAFTFDHHADRLIDFFRRVIERRSGQRSRRERGRI